MKKRINLVLIILLIIAAAGCINRPAPPEERPSPRRQTEQPKDDRLAKSDKEAVEENIRPIEQFFYILILFFGLLGLINALNSIRASLESRRRDFELLRSTGLDERQELGIYLWEAAFFSAAPILAAIPVAVVMLIVLKAFLFKALPVSGWLGRLSPLLLLSAALPWMAVVFATYCFGGRRMKG